MKDILGYQQKCFRNYSASIGLPTLYTYIDGNPIRPLPPVQTRCGNVMIVGAYPSARFESRPGRSSKRSRLVPVGNNLQPFAREEYFDGQHVRVLESGEGLVKHVLKPLKLDLADCWVTDLVKVFLYKEEHLGSCGDVAPRFRPKSLRGQFLDLGRKSLPWLKEECQLCKPKLVIAQGYEVAQVVSGQSAARPADLLCQAVAPAESLGGVPVLYLPHPDACRRMEKWAKACAGGIKLAKKTLKPRNTRAKGWQA